MSVIGVEDRQLNSLRVADVAAALESTRPKVSTGISYVPIGPITHWPHYVWRGKVMGCEIYLNQWIPQGSRLNVHATSRLQEVVHWELGEASMKQWELGDGKTTVGRISSAQELERTLKTLATSQPRSPILTLGPVEGDHFMQLGVSNDCCFLEFHPQDDPPYYVSVGSANHAENEGIKWFDYAGTPTEIPIRNCVSFQEMLGAVAEYLETESRPKCISWEES
jgi:hypothetical protein